MVRQIRKLNHMSILPVPPDEPPKKKKPPRRVTTSKTWVERGPLAPWMLRYATWLATHPDAELSRAKRPGEKAVVRGRPYTSERTAAASLIAKRVIHKDLVQTLERREDFIRYYTKVREDAVFLARELGKQQIARSFEARAQGPEWAMEAKDHKSVDLYTRPMLDVAFPKKHEGEQAAPRITINLVGSGSDAKALLGKVLAPAEEVQDVEWEPIETEKLLESGEEEE
jgi:hypothetical protein